MTNNQKTNINREIYIEKTNFISDNSSFFHANSENLDVMFNLKAILLNPAPLKECEGYAEIIEEMKKQKVRSEKQHTYQYTMETIFAIVYLIRRHVVSEEKLHQQTEQIRKYVKFVNEKDTGKMYYSEQNVIQLNEKDVEFVKNKKRA